MLVREFSEILYKLYPLNIQEPYDNAGGQIVFGDSNIKGILLSLDVDDHVVDEAIHKDCNVILAHHPVFFKPLRTINIDNPRSRLAIRIIENKISVFAAHTNYDKLCYPELGGFWGLHNMRVLLSTGVLPDGTVTGFGVAGELPQVMRLKELLAFIKKKLGTDFIIYCGNELRAIKKIAFMNGAGGSAIEKIIIGNDVDCIITGDAGYHHYAYAVEHGISVIDAGHFGTERILLNFLKDDILECLTKKNSDPAIVLYIAESETNPMKVYL